MDFFGHLLSVAPITALLWHAFVRGLEAAEEVKVPHLYWSWGENGNFLHLQHAGKEALYNMVLNV